MGEVISRKAARERTIEDVKATRTRAAARASGPDRTAWAVAEGRLASVSALWDATLAKANAARAELTPLAAAVDVADESSDHTIKSNAELIWNELGRPANDPVYELLFPGGAGFYADASEQPDMKLLLAEPLESNLQSKLTATVAPKVAAIREAASVLSAADRMPTAIARTAHFELAKLKRSSNTRSSTLHYGWAPAERRGRRRTHVENDRKGRPGPHVEPGEATAPPARKRPA